MRTTCSFCSRRVLSTWADYGLCAEHYKIFFSMHDHLNRINGPAGVTAGAALASEPILVAKTWDGRTWPDDFADQWRCSRCGRVWAGATTGKPPYKCLCPDDGVITLAVTQAGAAPREAIFEQDLHADAMALAYDDANEWQGRCPKGYKANLLAQRIEELVERLLEAHEKNP